MKTVKMLFWEVRRMFKEHPAQLIMLLSVLSPLAGLTLYKLASAETMLSMYLANPALTGGVVSGILFGLLTVYELDRTVRNRVDVITDAVVSPMRTALIRLLTLLFMSLVMLLITTAVWCPVTLIKTGAVFDMTDHCLAYILFMGLPMPAAILAAAAAYQFTRRADLSLVLFAAFAGLSLTVWADDWQLCWLNPCVWALSDDFSNFRIFRSAAYMRMTWLTALAGIWVLSWLCIRQHGKGILGSLIFGSRRIYRPAAALLLIACSGAAYAAQPIVDHSNPDQTVMIFDRLPSPEGVTCTGREVRVYPDTDAGTVEGIATYLFRNTSGQARTAAFGINPGYKISAVKANGVDTPFSAGDYQEYNEALLEVTVPAEEEIELTVEYGGFPQEDNSLSTMQGRQEISGEYICLENADMAPRLINVSSEDGVIPVTVEITLPEHMTVIPFGTAEAERVSENGNGTAVWRYEDTGTGGILYAGDYIRQDIEAGGITVQFYYGRRHREVMEAAGAADAVKAVVDYCTEHYGRLSFGTGETLKLIQSRVSGGGYAADGASLLDEADFTAANLNDGGKGAVPGEVMIHELVHQWWGLANMFDISDDTSPWSAEGLTVYTTYRIVKELYGGEHAEKYYAEQWRRETDDHYLNYYVRHPEYLDTLPKDKKTEVLGSLTYVRQYCEMPLKILKAEKLVGGEEAMDKILHDLFNRELDPGYPYLTYQNFLDACGLREEDLDLA